MENRLDSTPKERKLIEIFKEIDLNQDGYVSRDELIDLFVRNNYSLDEVNSIMIKSDEDRDGKICIAEFKKNFELF
jgi:Ca2+-binding EF-hand superfamily protein